MAFRLYVGNYPCDFLEDDVKNLFQDFAGIMFEKQVRKGMKCFSFFNCKDIDLLVSVIQKMNKADVQGRKLVVRAVEKNVQDYVEVLLKDIDTDDKKPLNPYSSLVPLQVMKNSIHSPQKREENDAVVREEAILSDSSNYQQEKYRPPLENKSYVPVRASHGSYRQSHKNNSREMCEQVSNSPSKSSLDHQNYKNSSNHESLQTHDEKPQYQSRKLHESAQYEEHSLENSEDKYPDSSKSSLEHQQNYNKLCDHEGFHINDERPQYQSRKLHENVRYEEHYDEYSKNKYLGSSKSSMDHHHNYRKSSNHESFQTNEERPQFDKSAQYEEYYDENSGDIYQSSHSPSQYTNSDVYCASEKEIDCESPESSGTWVSVSNFPFYTSIRSIYELFSDYQPIHVFMVSNSPRYRRMTEAQVCFPNQDVADDVIMNFDNTFYEGRLLVVNDMEDLTVLDELLAISSC